MLNLIFFAAVVLFAEYLADARQGKAQADEPHAWYWP